MSKITYENKVGVEPKTVAINQVQDVDMNMVKSVVNDNDTTSVSTAYPVFGDKTSAGRRYGAFANPLTGTIILSDSNIQEGGCAVVIWSGNANPNFSGGTINSVVGSITSQGTYTVYLHYLNGRWNVNLFTGGTAPPPSSGPAEMEINSITLN